MYVGNEIAVPSRPTLRLRGGSSAGTSGAGEAGGGGEAAAVLRQAGRVPKGDGAAQEARGCWDIGLYLRKKPESVFRKIRKYFAGKIDKLMVKSISAFMIIR